MPVRAYLLLKLHRNSLQEKEGDDSVKTRAPYQSKSYDTPTVPLEGTMAPRKTLLLDLFIYFQKTSNSRGDDEYNVCHNLSFCIKILEPNMNIQEMRNLH